MADKNQPAVIVPVKKVVTDAGKKFHYEPTGDMERFESLDAAKNIVTERIREGLKKEEPVIYQIFEFSSIAKAKEAPIVFE